MLKMKLIAGKRINVCRVSTALNMHGGFTCRYGKELLTDALLGWRVSSIKKAAEWEPEKALSKLN